jgi:hypothetical protein
MPSNKAPKHIVHMESTVYVASTPAMSLPLQLQDFQFIIRHEVLKHDSNPFRGCKPLMSCNWPLEGKDSNGSPDLVTSKCRGLGGQACKNFQVTNRIEHPSKKAQ